MRSERSQGEKEGDDRRFVHTRYNAFAVESVAALPGQGSGRNREAMIRSGASCARPHVAKSQVRAQTELWLICGDCEDFRGVSSPSGRAVAAGRMKSSDNPPGWRFIFSLRCFPFCCCSSFYSAGPLSISPWRRVHSAASSAIAGARQVFMAKTPIEYSYLDSGPAERLPQPKFSWSGFGPGNATIMVSELKSQKGN